MPRHRSIRALGGLVVLVVCLGTDNRLMSGVTLTREYEHARDDLDFSWEELVMIARNGFQSAYAVPAVIESMTDTLEREVAAAG